MTNLVNEAKVKFLEVLKDSPSNSDALFFIIEDIANREGMTETEFETFTNNTFIACKEEHDRAEMTIDTDDED